MTRLRTLARKLGLGRIRLAPRSVSYFLAPRVASAARKWWLRVRNPHIEIEIGDRVYLGPGFSLVAPHGPAKLSIGDRAEFRRGFTLELQPGALVRIGRDTRFTYGCLIQCTGSIEIGERCLFAASSAIFDGSHRFGDLDRPVLEQGYDLRPISIGSDVTVSAKCTVVNDIGDQSFIGANAVVTTPIPARSLAVGVPARVVETLGAAPASH